MDLARLRALRELSIRKTMAAVAEALYISPSAVSQQIALLEQEVGLDLIERRGRGVELTPAGKQLVARAEHGCFVSNSLTAKPRHRWIVNGQEVL